MPPLQANGHARYVVAYLNHASFWQPLHMLRSAWLERRSFAFWLVDMVRPKILVEVGTDSDFAFLAFCQVVRLGLPTACYAIDIWAEDERAGFWSQEVYGQPAAINARHYRDLAQLIRSRFDETMPHFGDGAVDLSHINGRRGYQEARTAFETWHPDLSARAVVLLRDTNVRDREFGVWRLWAELIRQYPSFEFLHGHGLGVPAIGPETPQVLAPLFEASAERRETIRAAYARLGAPSARRARLTKRGRNASRSCTSIRRNTAGCGPISRQYGWKAPAAGPK